MKPYFTVGVTLSEEPLVAETTQRKQNEMRGKECNMKAIAAS